MANPVLLALPHRPATPNDAQDDGSALARLHILESDYSPKIERSLLVDLLSRSVGFAESLADRVEMRNQANPLAALNDYKHRLQAIRREYASVRFRADELQAELAETRSALQRSERHAEYLQFTLDRMQASRAWKLVEKCSGWRRKISRFFGMGKR